MCYKQDLNNYFKEMDKLSVTFWEVALNMQLNSWKDTFTIKGTILSFIANDQI